MTLNSERMRLIMRMRIGYGWAGSMNVLIQDIQTAQFLTHDNRWTKNPAEAENYGFSLTAHSAARMLNLQGYQILFYCPETHYQILIYSSEGTQPSPQSN